MKQIEPYIYESPAEGKMNVPVRVYANEELIEHFKNDNVLKQARGVACLPGIVRASFTMPDAHWGYGFPIGGVAAFDPENDGVISPGGIGYDINCGVRMIRTDIKTPEMHGKLTRLIQRLYNTIPSGVGSEGGIKSLSKSELKQVMLKGAAWAVENGWGIEDDLLRTESGGAMEAANPDAVGDRAVQRGRPQAGTLGSGNHFLEIDRVDTVYDSAAAQCMGIEKDLIVVQLHCGSRGFGHQICSDAIKKMHRAVERYGIDLPDKQLACAPLKSPEGRNYYGAMASAANFAWCNRQILQSLALKAFSNIFDAEREELGWRQIYDVCHNIAKYETHHHDGRELSLCVHRKGATRAFPPGHSAVPDVYKSIGQPVLIPGDMGSESYLLVGAEKSMEKTWGSTCHGAGRVMGRKAAVRKSRGHDLKAELKARNVTVMARGKTTMAEEMPYAYKDVTSVVDVMENTGITRKVARLRPIGVIKG